MQIQSLNGKWEIRWSTGQRGGTPFVIKHRDDREHLNEVTNRPRTLPGRYRPEGWLPAAVPGEIHLDLMKLGILEDPHIGLNVLSARWVEECVWHYRRTFDAPEAAAAKKAFLVLESVYLDAIVYINGEEAGRHANAFYPLCIDVTGKLKPFGNEILVRVESGLFQNADRPIQNTPTATASMDLLLHKRLWLRIPQNHTEWDWSPRLLNVGIGGNVQILYGDAVVTGHSVRQQVAADLNSAEIEGRLFGDFTAPGPYTLCIEALGRSQTREFEAVAGGEISVSLKLENPPLWYPVGYGPQTLFPVTLRLYREGRLITEKTVNTGLRRVDVLQPPHPKIGHYFIIRVNGIKIFFKGSNFVPASLITAAVTPERYEALIDRALEANFNILRVWGGGQYETDVFYELCNRKGIMVWQDFISACGPLPVHDEAFLADLKTEAVYNLRRLSAHPSLIVWCGNNEVVPYGNDFYMKILPELTAREDPEKYYQPASPYTSDDLAFAPKNNAEWDFAGDQHPWSVGFLEKDHRKYREMECRFPNEGGILGPVSLPATRLCCGDLPGEHARTVASELHDNMLHFWKEGTSPDEDLKFWTGFYPGELTTETYVYAAGMVQGEGLTNYIDNFRRRAFDSSSAIFWMFNDIWPASRSWTIVDYLLNRTPSFYHVKRAFSPVRVILVRNGKNIDVYVSNFRLAPFRGVLEFGVFGFDGRYRLRETLAVEAEPNASTVVASFPAEDENHVPFALLFDKAGVLISRNRLLDKRYFEYEFSPPNITVTLTQGKYVFESDVFVMGVCLDLDGTEPLADNMFDLYPGIPYDLELPRPPVILHTLNDVLLQNAKAEGDVAV